MDELTEQSRQRIGRLLKVYRTKAGLSLAEVAKLAQYSKSAVYKIEQGRGDLTLDMARAVDRVLSTGGRFVAALSEPKFFRPAQLPVVSGPTAGMDAEFRRLEGWLYQSDRDDDGTARHVMVVTGPPWIGTSTLMLRAAHSVTAVGLFPDGQLYADLAGFREDQPARAPDEVLASFLRALGAWVPPDASRGELTQHYRTALAGRELLIVLDNAASAAQIEPLLPGAAAPGCRVLVASRLSLSSVTTSMADRIEVGPVTQSQLETLLTRLLGQDHPVAHQPDAISCLAAGAAGYPAVVRRTAGWLADNPDYPIMSRQAYEEAMFDPRDVWGPRAPFDASYRYLSPGAQRLFRLLGTWDGQAIGVAAAARLLDESDAEASACLSELSAANLVRSDRSGGRYRHVALLRRYGRYLGAVHDSVRDRTTAIGRMLSWYLQTAIAAERALAPESIPLIVYQLPVDRTEPAHFESRNAALEWIHAERENLTAIVRLASETGHYTVAWQFALACQAGLAAAAEAAPKRWWGSLWRDVLEGARLVALVDDEQGYALTTTLLAHVYLKLGEFELAAAVLQAACRVWRRLAVRTGAAADQVRRGLGWATSAHSPGCLCPVGESWCGACPAVVWWQQQCAADRVHPTVHGNPLDQACVSAHSGGNGREDVRD